MSDSKSVEPRAAAGAAPLDKPMHCGICGEGEICHGHEGLKKLLNYSADPGGASGSTPPVLFAALATKLKEECEAQHARAEALAADRSRLWAALKKLVEQWRVEAEESLERWPRGAILPSKKLRQCADQLAALLPEGPTK